MQRDMASGQFVAGALAQARPPLRHCASILESAGSGAGKNMRAMDYEAELDAKDAVNEAIAKMFDDHPPARNLVEV